MLRILNGVKLAQDDTTGDIYAVDCCGGPKNLSAGGGGGSGTNPNEYRITGQVDANEGDKGVLIEGTFEGLRDAVIAGKHIVGHAIQVATNEGGTKGYVDMPVFSCIYIEDSPDQVSCVTFSAVDMGIHTFRVYSDNTFAILP